MTTRPDCRHYSTRTVASGEIVRRCRLGMAEDAPFDCPEGCVFFEPRRVADSGWQIADEEHPSDE